MEEAEVLKQFANDWSGRINSISIDNDMTWFCGDFSDRVEGVSLEPCVDMDVVNQETISVQKGPILYNEELGHQFGKRVYSATVNTQVLFVSYISRSGEWATRRT